MKRNTVNWIAGFALALGISLARAQEPAPMPEMNHGDMPSGTADGGHGMGGMNAGASSMQGGSAPPGARDPHAFSGGYGFGPIPRPRLADEHNFGSLVVDRLEGVKTRGASAAAYDVSAWYGRDYDRAVLKAEGEVDGGELHEARTELLWSHAVAAYWDVQVGARYDGGEDPSRSWLAFGVQGLAPYWFEVDAAAYIGEKGHTAFRLSAEYDLLLTQRLILQPSFEANAYGKRDADRSLGSGLSDAVAGLRLRYEIRREFAPYVGIERAAKFGGTADVARAAGEDTAETRYVAGVRFWF